MNWVWHVWVIYSTREFYITSKNKDGNESRSSLVVHFLFTVMSNIVTYQRLLKEVHIWSKLETERQLQYRPYVVSQAPLVTRGRTQTCLGSQGERKAQFHLIEYHLVHISGLQLEQNGFLNELEATPESLVDIVETHGRIKHLRSVNENQSVYHR